MSFFNLVKRAKEDSKSEICVGLDLAAFGTRLDFTINKEDKKLDILLNLIESLSPYCCCFKVNRQYMLDLSHPEIKQVTQKAHAFSRPIIVDHKLSDIGATNEQAINAIAQEGFDSFIFSPFPGNIQETCSFSHNYNLTSIMLVLMSNPEAVWMKTAKINNIPFFQYYAKLANKYADGAVVGATNHVGENELKIINEELIDKFILVPGIGAQGGDVEKIIRIFKNNVLINIGRSIIYQKNPVEALKSQNKVINSIKQYIYTS
ncbi:MAG: orotidine 5'-phosphate decarboxylase [Candidatus Hodarchaeota archaeon]